MKTEVFATRELKYYSSIQDLLTLLCRLNENYYEAEQL
jgi:hypothetical protein